MLPARHASSRRRRSCRCASRCAQGRARGRLRGHLLATGVAVLALAAGALTGCSGGDDAGPEALPAPPPAVTIDPDAVVEGEDRFGEPSEASPAPVPPSPDQLACAALQAAWNATNQALVNLSADHPRALVDSFRAAAESMDGVTEVPDAVAGPWATYSGYLARVNEGFESVDADDANAVAAAMSAAVTSADTREATAAGEQITAFANAGCVAGP